MGCSLCKQTGILLSQTLSGILLLIEGKIVPERFLGSVFRSVKEDTMFIDIAKIKIVSGKGGDGKVGFTAKSMWQPAVRRRRRWPGAARSSSRWTTICPRCSISVTRKKYVAAPVSRAAVSAARARTVRTRSFAYRAARSSVTRNRSGHEGYVRQRAVCSS